MNTQKRKKVHVLMSTYNGERYLQEQIDSILQQEDVEICLFVRDDGSTDNTLKILQDYQGKGFLQYYQGNNIGPAKSFMELLGKSPQADFYAFSDQDDFWMKDKIISALKAIGQNVEPSLYYCQTQLTNKNLQPFESVCINPYGTFGEALIYQFIGGCTMVFNDALRNIVIEYTPQYLAMHDVWIYDIAKAINATVVFDPTPHILYRQHGHNVIGQGYSNWKEWKRRIHRIFLEKEHLRYMTAVELQYGYFKKINQENKDILTLFIGAKRNPFKRFKLLFDRRFRCQPNDTYRNFLIAVLLNTY